MFILLILFTLLILFITPFPIARAECSSYPFLSQFRLAYTSFQRTSPHLEEDKIKQTIDSYFRLRYEGQRLLQAQDDAFLVAEGQEAQQWRRKAQDRQEIELAIASAYQLAYQDYKYQLDYETIQVQGTQAIARLYESHQVVFQATAPEISRLGRLLHTIQLRQEQGSWKIVRDDYVDELSFVLAGESKERILKRIQAQLAAEKAAARLPGASRRDRFPPQALAPYDRAAAVAYADAWGRWAASPDDWRNPHYHDEPGYDCANFVSQAIYAGVGEVMSEPVSYERQWYYDFFTHSGSLPWLRVSSFAVFISSNRAKGPTGAFSASLCTARPGDVVQLYSASGWFHQAIIVARLPGSGCSAKTATLINAHTTDLYHYPLAHFSFTSLRYIRILGSLSQTALLSDPSTAPAALARSPFAPAPPLPDGNAAPSSATTAQRSPAHPALRR